MLVPEDVDANCFQEKRIQANTSMQTASDASNDQQCLCRLDLDDVCPVERLFVVGLVKFVMLSDPCVDTTRIVIHGVRIARSLRAR